MLEPEVLPAVVGVREAVVGLLYPVFAHTGGPGSSPRTGGGVMTLTAKQRAAYGPDWESISLQVRDRSGGRCECEGECGWQRHISAQAQQRMPSLEEWRNGLGLEPIEVRCRARNGEPSPYTGSRVVLTAAHLDRDGHTGAHDLGRIKAMCQGCHLSYDRQARA